ncbi:hypothetical protein [Flagellimonas sp.]|uniref:hypothetical protein n=1 Tax=Flagellimonas sp. TaxID=2058762 RepID=UPI003F49E597
MKNSFSQYHGIKPSDIDFFDIPLDSDVEVFICPFLIENTKMKIPFSRKVYDRLVGFLTELNKNYVRPNKRNLGISFLSHLHEPNEIHFGYSSSNKGKAVAKEKATMIFDALRRNRFAKKGLHTTNQAHNVLLLVQGIGQDIMSDIILNVCRDIFAEFTFYVIEKQGIKNTKKFECEYYDYNTKKWKRDYFNLPVYKGKKIILVPRKIVSGKRAYSERYNWFVSSNYISVRILNKPKISRKEQRLFKKLKNGTKIIIIKRVYEAYKKPKKDIIDFVINYPGSLDEFVQYAKENYPEIDLSDL